MSKLEYIKKYKKEKCKGFYISLHTENDRDIIERLEAAANKAGYIKELVREDIKGGILFDKVLSRSEAENFKRILQENGIAEERGEAE